jgi:diadenylate cyclase
VVIFQPELRRGLAELGGHPIFSLTSEKRETVQDLVEAVSQLANKQFGALIAIERDTAIRVYEETGWSSMPCFRSSSCSRFFIRRARYTTAES